MASAVTTTPDTLVTLKVNFDGNTRRFKLPLRDLGASSLEDKLRGFLMIPHGTSCTFERYSDSAAAYVVLDPNNVSVYKQLYRAAKAKQKLKLRVTTREEVEEVKEEKMVPRPVTVEDEPEPSQPSSATPDLIKLDEPAITPTPTVTVPAPSTARPAQPTFASEDLLGKSIAMAEREQKVMERSLKIIEASVAKLHKDPEFNVSTARAAYDALREAGKKAPSAAQDKASSEPAKSEVEFPVLSTRPNFTVCCNSCDNPIPDSHYHCATCDDGDFDLCQGCVDKGITCYGADHWLIKRSVKNGVIISSTTERIAPKPKAPIRPAQIPTTPAKPEAVPVAERIIPVFSNYAYSNIRTCNSCVQELPEHDFVHCMSCDDFDLCKSCFVKDQHGHHPKHPFVLADASSTTDDDVDRRLGAGRGQKHNAICDGCDKYVLGVRHKCLDCPDWDYCEECVVNAEFIHPNHRFVPIYEPIADMRARGLANSRPVHYGITCDGPLCSTGRAVARYIVGDRYKCAVCHDTDYCANCEASPANTHNKTHPLIKFKTPVRHVNVTTTGEREDGQRMPVMGDRIPRHRASTSSRATETTLTNQPIAATNVQTVVDVQPSEPAVVAPVKVEEKEAKHEEPEAATPTAEKAPTADDLCAIYVKDTIADGTVMPPDHVFEQTWVLRNSGMVSWPAGCAVKYVGGDYMGHVDPKHPVAIQKLVSASESTICYAPLAPGQSFAFTVLLRTPAREGKFISYWRLTTKDGIKFGHRLWCDVEVQSPKPAKEIKEEVQPLLSPTIEEPKADDSSSKSEGSQMIFPKLEKESPIASVHEELKPEVVPASRPEHDADEFEECDEDDEWAEEDSDDGMVTDEEYDILDASDEEYLEEQQKLLKK